MEETLYYIHINGRQIGPFLSHQLRANGVRPETMVWRAGLPNWVPASTLPELNYIFAVPEEPVYTQPQFTTPPPAQPYAWQQQGNNVYGAPQYRPTGTYPPGWYNWMTWAIIGTVGGVLLCFVGMIFGIIAIVKSNSANNAAIHGDPNAENLNSQAKTWTITSLVLSGLAILGVIAYFVILFYGFTLLDF